MPTSSRQSQNTSLSPQKDSSNNSRTVKAFNISGKPFQLFSVLPYYFVFVLYAVGYISVKYYHNPYWVVLFLYVGLPLMDYSISDDWLNPDKEQSKVLLNNFWFKIPVYGQVILDSLFLPWMVYYLTTGEFSWTFYLGAITLCGLLSSLHFGNAHELFHKKSAFDKVVGSLTVAKNYYIHYYLDHTYGHHKYVATYDDPTSSRYGESLYQYLPRCVIGAYKSAWKIENERLIKRQGFKTPLVPQNRMIWITLTYILLPIVVYQLLGLKGVLVHLAIVLMSITSFETVEYLEHYGLTRKLIGPNEYEPVNVTHSWNAPQRISNYILFKVQRHSDHHHNAYKPYQVLSSYDESPCLPHGYTLCQIVAFVPPVFFKMMDILLKAIKENRDLTTEETKTINRNSYSLVVVFGSLFAGLWILNQSYLNNAISN